MTTNDENDDDYIKNYDLEFDNLEHHVSGTGLSLTREGFHWQLKDTDGQVVWQADVRLAGIRSLKYWDACVAIVTKAFNDRFANVVSALAGVYGFVDPPRVDHWIWHHPHESLQVRFEHTDGVWMSVCSLPGGEFDIRYLPLGKFPTEDQLRQELRQVSDDLSLREEFKMYLDGIGRSWETPRNEKGMKIGAIHVGFERGAMPILIPKFTDCEEVETVIGLIKSFQKDRRSPIAEAPPPSADLESSVDLI